MNTKISFRFARFAQPTLIVLLLSILIFVSAGSNVKGQIGGDGPLSSQNEIAIGAVIEGGSPVPGGPGFIMVSPFDFKPYHPTYLWDYEGKSLYNPGTGFSEYVAGLTLPNGATITKITLFLKDNSSSDMVLYLMRGSWDITEYQMAHILSESYETFYRYLSSTSIDSPLVDNQTFSYHLHAVLPGNVGQNIMLTNVRVDYAYEVAAPLVMR